MSSQTLVSSVAEDSGGNAGPQVPGSTNASSPQSQDDQSNTALPDGEPSSSPEVSPLSRTRSTLNTVPLLATRSQARSPFPLRTPGHPILYFHSFRISIPRNPPIVDRRTLFLLRRTAPAATFPTISLVAFSTAAPLLQSPPPTGQVSVLVHAPEDADRS
jgi:hypothetical protein